MIKERKTCYEAPVMELVELKGECVICQSGLKAPDNYDYGGDPFNF